MPRKLQPPPEEITAKIERFEHTYYFSQDADPRSKAEDEGAIELTGTIVDISKRHRRFLHEPIGITLLYARTFDPARDAPAAERPFFMYMNLSKRGCGCGGYIPSDAFWALPSMLREKAVTHAHFRFQPTQRGSGSLLSIYLAPGDKVEPIS
ncbi:hypothetical protein [Novosphingobium aerophilum]|uniref:Uncharacterized protein n=1 Tax=Novosphingobium aerophilum TaxID=2839843 RepID=A0A7X1FAW1_9SPHN|nr:hypothetical protein [Novosphingobium aerophilum]MBC2653608.1 hypothetical protein [Novosphingobium aerophilum]